MDRNEVWKKVADKTLNQTKAAKLLGISRQRASQLFAKWKKNTVNKIFEGIPKMNPKKDPLAEVFKEPTPNDLPPLPPPPTLPGVPGPNPAVR